MHDTIRIFIGCGPRFEEPTHALITSIYENCSQPDRLDVRLMEAWADPLWSNWKGQPTEENFGRVKGNWVTPFSLFRFAIPEICGYEGRAIYLDCDMIVVGDIVELWNRWEPMKWARVPGPSGDCVMVMDCAAMRYDVALLKQFGTKQGLRRSAAEHTVASLPDTWNHCDRYVEGVSNLVHYTSMKSQPFRPYPEVLDYVDHPDHPALDLYKHYVERSKDWQWQTSSESISTP